MTDEHLTGDQQPSIVDGRYRLIERVGSGGMADVYCAEDLQLGRKVALKLLHRRFAEDEEFVERFRREASAAAGLAHPHVVAVYDRGTWDGTYYIAMEYLDGRSLKRVVLDDGPLHPDRAIDLTIQILRAARFAHRRGIIHRDLKPHNVIVEAGPPERAKVTDFGIARAGASDMTQTGSIMGTAQYLSPEQAQGHAVSAASDLYSVGVILYEMLTGRVPFEGESAVTIALKHVSEPPEPPHRFNAEVSPALEAVVLRAMEKDAARRYADADEFIAALEAVQAGLAPPAPVLPPTTPPVLAATGAYAPVPTTGAYEAVSAYDQAAAYDALRPPPLPPREDEHGGGRWWVALLAGLVVAGVIVAALLLLQKDEVKVPSVVGQRQAAAETRLRREGLSTDVTTRPSDTVPEGIVVSQDPGGGSRIDKGDIVTLVVSSGRATARIPDLEGEPRSAAIEELTKLGFKVEEDKENSDSITTNRVIGTRPANGEVLTVGETVTLVVSSGRERAAVPPVTGLSEADARTALEGAGFVVSVREQETADRDPGTVLAQDPTAGARPARGSTVVITVAKQPAEVEVPSVLGATESEASGILSDAGLRSRATPQVVQDPAQDGRVIAQDPGDGRAARDSVVTLTIGVFEPPAQTTPTTGTPEVPAP